MASLIWEDKLNSSIEIMKIQYHTVSVCMNAIHDKIADESQNCAQIDGLLNQLELLCQMLFKYDEQLLEEMNYPAVSEQRRLHDSYLKAIDLFKTENEQCHTAAFMNDFIKLRLDYVLNRDQETMMLCDYLLKTS